MSTVLDRPRQPVLVAELLGRRQQREVILSVRADGLRRQLPTLLIDGDDDVRALVRVDPESDDEPCLLRVEGIRDRPVGTALSWTAWRGGCRDEHGT
jgi:hypothetical protein